MSKARLMTAGAMFAIAACGPAHARIVVEDFMQPDGLTPGYDPFFDYDFGGVRDFDAGDSHNLLIGSLLLSPERVVISFNTLPGETVLGATIRAQEFSAPGQTLITFRGELGSFSIQSSVMTSVQTYTAPPVSIGQVHTIEIVGLQTLIRDITIETADPVPAPAGGMALALAGTGLLARRRRR